MTPGPHDHEARHDRAQQPGTTQLYFDDARVPRSNLVGQVGKGWEYIGEHLEYERLSLAASYVGNARTALDDTMRYTKGRKQFGRPLSSFQVLKHRMAENECEDRAARLLTTRPRPGWRVASGP